VLSGALWCSLAGPCRALPTLPTSSVASGAAIAVCFAPEEDCSAFAVRAIDNAEREIMVGAHRLKPGSRTR